MSWPEISTQAISPLQRNLLHNLGQELEGRRDESLGCYHRSQNRNDQSKVEGARRYSLEERVVICGGILCKVRGLPCFARVLAVEPPR